MPNGDTIQSSKSTQLDILPLRSNEQPAYVCPNLQPHSLLSIGKLCDAGCEAIFTVDDVTIMYNNIPILNGQRNPHTNLWHLPVPLERTNTTKHMANSVNHPTSPAMLVAFAHAALFSPTISTLQNALDKSFLVDIPGLTSYTLKTHPPSSIATIKGHLDQIRQHLNPTVPPSDDATTLQPTDDSFNHPPKEEHTNYCYAALHHMNKTPQGQVYTNQTGKFAVTSSRGYNYVLILYDFDSNSIHAVPLKTKNATEMVTAFTQLYDTLIQAGLRPKLHRLDNECSTILKQYMASENVTVQLVPPGIHRANAAERAIRTFKNHFIAGLCTADPNFPAHLLDLLLPQAVMTLNLLCASRTNPQLSAHCHVYGQYLYTKTPIAPPGCHILVHQKPGNRTSWGVHALDAWYLGPAPLHYRCFRAWIWETRSERISDTISWLPKHVSIPQYNVADQLLDETKHLVQLIKQLPNDTTSPLFLDPTHTQSLHNIAEILGTIKTPSTPLPASWPPLPPINIEREVTDADVPPTDNTGNPEPAPLLRVPGTTAATPQLGTIVNDQNQRRTLRPKNPPPRLRKYLFHCHHDHQLTDDSPPPFIGSAINCDSRVLTEYIQLLRTTEGHLWENSAVEEWARLVQGCPPQNIPVTDGTNTIRFIKFHEIPAGRKATYPRVVVADRPQKANPRRVRITVGGDRIDYPRQVATKTAGMMSVKTLLNSVISTPSARFMSIDIKDFYLNTPMKRAEYMRIDLKLLPAAIIKHYDLTTILHNGGVYVEITKGMYGLPQAGILANDELVKHLSKHGYHQCPHTHGVFTHDNRPIAFCLVVDDFGVKYEGKEHAEHLITTLKLQYSITIDWPGTLYIGLTLTWDYPNKTVDISMPQYVTKALQSFGHVKPIKPQHAPHSCIPPNYGAKVQYTEADDDTPLLSAAEVKRLQQIIGVFLYYARAVDSTMLVALGALAAVQTTATQKTKAAAAQFLDYAATHPSAIVRYQASPMILNIHSDASYLSETHSRSWAGGIFFFATKAINQNNNHLNGAGHIVSIILKIVVASAAEAEVAALYFNAQEACPLRNLLITLDHPQPPTPLTTDNKCASGILNATVKQRRSKAIDMRFYWLKDRIQQKQYTVTWAPGNTNQADYFTKHHPPKHHQLHRAIYLHNSDTKQTTDE